MDLEHEQLGKVDLVKTSFGAVGLVAVLSVTVGLATARPGPADSATEKVELGSAAPEAEVLVGAEFESAVH